jgi:hypothetical protein
LFVAPLSISDCCFSLHPNEQWIALAKFDTLFIVPSKSTVKREKSNYMDIFGQVQQNQQIQQQQQLETEQNK